MQRFTTLIHTRTYAAPYGNCCGWKNGVELYSMYTQRRCSWEIRNDLLKKKGRIQQISGGVLDFVELDSHVILDLPIGKSFLLIFLIFLKDVNSFSLFFILFIFQLYL
jgi:hypothetical protein